VALIALATFKETLRVGDLYANAQLEGVMEAAEDIVLSYLSQYRYAVDQTCCTTANTIKLRTTTWHELYVGQTVTLVGFTPGQYDGQAVVAEVGEDTTAATLGTVPAGKVPRNTAVVTKAHGQTPYTDPHPLIPNGTIYDQSQEGKYDDVEPVREAALAIAVDLWQSGVAPGGQLEAVDFTPGPYRLGRSLVSRVSGLLGPYMNTRSLVG